MTILVKPNTDPKPPTRRWAAAVRTTKGVTWFAQVEALSRWRARREVRREFLKARPGDRIDRTRIVYAGGLPLRRVRFASWLLGFFGMQVAVKETEPQLLAAATMDVGDMAPDDFAEYTKARYGFELGMFIGSDV